ncbi:sensor histidine kinase [Bacteroides sp. OttesenSCG-928-N06]|nr:sensor histidine kinase [Bacteroides sp. OttesenSCG-928-N06]
MKNQVVSFNLKRLLLICLLLLPVGRSFAQPSLDSILIISSHKSDASTTAANISEFISEYKALGGKLSTVVESMNTKSLAEATEWHARMKNILLKYRDGNQPAMIVLLGEEAVNAYMAQDKNIVNPEVPVLCGMMGNHAFRFADVSQSHKATGIFYDYDVNKNIQLIRQLYPEVEHIAFLSDNTCSGVSMQAEVREQMRNYPELGLILLDGSTSPLAAIVKQIASLPANTALLVDTWNVDASNHYYTPNVLYNLIGKNKKVPIFTLAEIGMKHGAMGGYMPLRQNIGKELAMLAGKYAEQPDAAESIAPKYVENKYVFDYKKITQAGIQESNLPKPHEMRNQTSAADRINYPLIAIICLLGLLLLGYLIVFYYFFGVRKLKEKAEESDRLKSAFLANMSHEIRTPLNAIVGFSGILTDESLSEEERESYAEIIQTNSDLLLRLINDILDISRLETDRVTFNFVPCEIVALCDKVISTARYARKNNLTFVLDAPFESYTLTADVQRLQQVLINLMSNAVKFTAEGTVTLSIREDAENDQVIFSVTDTGCGIPIEKQKKVFERFEKLNEYAQGTGLGLSICKITIDLLGGDIWVDETYTQGARFVFTHPRNPKIKKI